MRTVVLEDAVAVCIERPGDLGIRFGATTFRLWSPPFDVLFLVIVGSALGCAGLMTVELLTGLSSRASAAVGDDAPTSIFQLGLNRYFCAVIGVGVSAFAIALARADDRKIEAFEGRSVTQLRGAMRRFHGLGVSRTLLALARAAAAILASWLLIAALVATIWLAEFYLPRGSAPQTVALAIALPLYALCLGAIVWAHRATTKSMAKAARDAGRKPIVLLRSFKDDNFRPAPAPDAMDVLFSETERARATESARRLEECIAPHISDFGPFVAVGEPGVQRAGAERVFLGDDEWQAQVLHWVRESLAIVVVAGLTEGLRWELNAIREAGAIERVILLWPDDNKAARLAVIQRYVRGTPWEAAMRAVEPAAIKAIAFRPGGKLFLVNATERRWGARVFEYAFNFALCASILPGAAGPRAA